MRRLLLGAIGGAVTLAACAALAAPRFADLPGKASPGAIGVDVELVLAVDISYSMDFDELKLQRDGYVEALTSKEFLDALKQGMHGKVAVTMVEWAGAAEQRIVIPWRLIEGPESAQKVAAELAAQPVRRAFRTSISGALLFSAPLFENNGFSGIRRVIDVSGDGTNNQGPLVHLTRDEVLAKGITINGLPIMLKEPQPNSVDLKDLDIYYEDCVIGGPGAFVVPIRERDKFKDAIRTKLVLDIARHDGTRARHSGCRERAAHLLHHRRSDVAAALGRQRYGPLRLAFEAPDDLHVGRVPKLVDRGHRRQTVTAIAEDACIARERRRHCRRPRRPAERVTRQAGAPAPPLLGAADRTRPHRRPSARQARAGGGRDRALRPQSA